MPSKQKLANFCPIFCIYRMSLTVKVPQKPDEVEDNELFIDPEMTFIEFDEFVAL